MEGDHENGSGSERSMWAAAGEFTGFGLTWALSVLLFLLGGWWVDGKLGTTPLLMIVGAFVGAGAGFYSLYRHVIASSLSNSKGSGGADSSDEGAKAGDR